MSINITAVHMSRGGSGHEHIESVRWENPNSHQTDESTRLTMVGWINGGNHAFVKGPHRTVAVGVWRVYFIRTHTDGDWTDNLLHLPRY